MSEEEDIFYLCEETEQELVQLTHDGRRILLRSFGECEVCEKYFSIEKLKTPNPVHDSWPIEYEGLRCFDCDLAEDQIGTPIIELEMESEDELFIEEEDEEEDDEK